MRGSLIIAAMCSGQASANPATIQLSGRQVTAGDLGVSTPSPNQVVARIAPGHPSLILTTNEQKRLLRNLYPGVDLKLRYEGDIMLFAAAEPSSVQDGARCYATRHAIAQGDYLDRTDLTSVACDRKATRTKLAYDRAAAAPYAATDIPAFSYVGAISLPSAKPLRAGSALTLRTMSGPVTIDRKVVALQPGHPGRLIFVRTGDGSILSRRVAPSPASETPR